MKLHIFRLSGHDFVHYRKIEIGANDRAVYQQSISCFIVYANFDWFLINLLLTLYFINKRNGRFFVPSFLLTPYNVHFRKIFFTFPCITLLIELSPNSRRSTNAIFPLCLYKSILSDLQFKKAMSRLYLFSIDLISSTSFIYRPSLFVSS